MRPFSWILPGIVLAAVFAPWSPAEPPALIPPPPDTSWSVRAMVVEATTDEGLSPVYDRKRPGSAEHRCRFMNALQVFEGRVGRVRLDGMTIVLAGDLGRDLERTPYGTLVVVTDPLATDAQRKAAVTLVRAIYPIRWARVVTATAPLSLETVPGGFEIRAGSRGSLSVKMDKDAGGKPVVRHGLQYWNATRNEDFRLGRGTFSYRSDGVDVKRANGGGFMTRFEAEGRAIDGRVALDR